MTRAEFMHQMQVAPPSYIADRLRALAAPDGD